VAALQAAFDHPLRERHAVAQAHRQAVAQGLPDARLQRREHPHADGERDEREDRGGSEGDAVVRRQPDPESRAQRADEIEPQRNRQRDQSRGGLQRDQVERAARIDEMQLE